LVACGMNRRGIEDRVLAVHQEAGVQPLCRLSVLDLAGPGPALVLAR
jgi:hypothetical protein